MTCATLKFAWFQYNVSLVIKTRELKKFTCRNKSSVFGLKSKREKGKEEGSREAKRPGFMPTLLLSTSSPRLGLRLGLGMELASFFVYPGEMSGGDTPRQSFFSVQFYTEVQF